MDSLIIQSLPMLRIAAECVLACAVTLVIINLYYKCIDKAKDIIYATDMYQAYDDKRSERWWRENIGHVKRYKKFYQDHDGSLPEDIYYKYGHIKKLRGNPFNKN